jgi:PPK2 family polyphosphate:nucleotide phosphotransferase
MPDPATDVLDTASLRVGPGPVVLTAEAASSKLGYAGDKASGKGALEALGAELADLQERLWANRLTGTERRVLVVLQGMDTSGKGGVIRKTLGLVDPQGLRITSFKAPTEEELAHDFLWRVRRAVPEPGYIGVFDRSHYEDVLIAKVRGLAPAEEIERRYDAINAFERELVDAGVVLVKCVLHVSEVEQAERLRARLDDPQKHWKYSPGDLDERALWPAYREAYETALSRTNTPEAPWHVVPADRKWLRNLAVGQLLLETLRRLDLRWPEADFDVEAEKARLASMVAR